MLLIFLRHLIARILYLKLDIIINNNNDILLMQFKRRKYIFYRDMQLSMRIAVGRL